MPGGLRQRAAVLHAVTDVGGRAQLHILGSAAVVRAEKAGLGDSVGRSVTARPPVHSDEVVLTIEPYLTLRGRVQDAGGAALAGATVWAMDFGGLRADGQRQPRRPSASSDAHGGFELRVSQWRRYRVCAALEAAHTFAVVVEVHDLPPAPIVLAVPGAIGVRGTVVDARGAPVANASVVGWRGERYERPFAATSDEHGGFQLLVPEFAEYQVMATHASLPASAPVVAAPNAVRPHVEVQLTMPDCGVIRGLVVDGEGAALTGVSVVARVRDDRTVVDVFATEPSPQERFGAEVATLTDVDGAFSLLVHPRGVFQVQATAIGGQQVVVHEVPAGGAPLRIVFDGAVCTVRGVVVRQDGGEVGDYRVLRLQESGPVRFTAELDVQRDAAAFTTTLSPIGHQCRLRVEPADQALAPAVLGPLEIVRGELPLTFVLRPRVRLDLTVFGADGAPTTGLRVAVIDASGDAVAGHTDAGGGVVLDGCAPGRSRLRCLRGTEVVHEQPLEVAPGDGRVTVVLPAAAISGR